MHAHLPGVDLARSFVDRDDPASVQGGIGIVVIAREQFGFGVHHEQFAAVIVEFDLPEEGHPCARRQAVGQISPVEPFAQDGGSRCIRELGLEQTQVAAAKTRKLRRAYLGHYGSQFARRELGDSLHIAPVFIAKREVVDEVFNRFESFRLEHGGARRSHPFDKGQGSG